MKRAPVELRQIYGEIADALLEIQPRNERARAWWKRLLFRCDSASSPNLSFEAHQQTSSEMAFEYLVFLRAHGPAAEQSDILDRVELLLLQLEAGSECSNQELCLDASTATVNDTSAHAQMVS